MANFLKKMGIGGWVGDHPTESLLGIAALGAGGYAMSQGGGGGGSGSTGGASGAAGIGGTSGTGGALSSTTIPSTSTTGGSTGPQDSSQTTGAISALMGGLGQPSEKGGQASLGGMGYQAYTQPTYQSYDFNGIKNSDTAVTGTGSQSPVGALAPSTTPTTVGTGGVEDTKAFYDKNNKDNADIAAKHDGSMWDKFMTSGANAWNKSTGGSGDADKDPRSFMERMSASGSDQWDNFMGQGKYDTNNKANLDSKGNLKAEGAMSSGDRLNAALGAANLISSWFDRR